MSIEAKQDSYKNLYRWVTGGIGLILNIITLYAFANSDTITSLTNHKNDSLLLFGNTWVEWKSITLIGLVIIAIIFVIVALYSSKDATEYAFNFLRLIYLFIIPGMLWLIIYYPFGPIQLYRHIFETWLVGLISLMVFPRIKTFGQGCISVGLLISLLWAGIGIFENSIEQSFWSEAAKASLGITILGIMAPWGLFLIAFLLVVGIVWLFSGSVWVLFSLPGWLLSITGVIAEVVQESSQTKITKLLLLLLALFVVVDIVLLAMAAMQ
jgi:hypothetical protein